MEIKITIGFNPEAERLLTSLFASIGKPVFSNILPDENQIKNVEIPKTAEPKKPKSNKEIAKEAGPAKEDYPEETPKQTPSAPVLFEKIRALTKDLVTTKEKTKEVKKLVDSFGVASLSEVPEDRHAEFYEALQKL